MTRWRGLVELVRDAVHHGTLGVEKVHQSVARTPLDLLALVPPLAPPARAIAACQAALIATTYATVRGVNAVAGAVVGACVDAAAREPREPPETVAGPAPRG